MDTVINEPYYKFKWSCSIIVAGASLSGKSVFTTKLIDNAEKLFSAKPQNIVISYAIDQPLYDNIKIKHNNVHFIHDLDLDKYSDSIIVIDDLMTDAIKSQKVQELFTRGVHHNRNTVIFITQNLLPQGKYGRDIRLNTHYFCIFKSPSFLSQVMYLGRSFFPANPTLLWKAYINATKEPYTYLFINLHPECCDQIRIRTGILPEEKEIIYA